MTASDELWRLWDGTSDAPERDALLTRLGSLGDATDLPDLLRIVFGDRRLQTAEEASGAIAAILRRQQPTDLPRYETAIRARLPPLTEPELRRSRPRLQLDQSWGAVGLCTLHANGYVREVAVHWLAAAPEAEALPLLVLRLNDWVAPIRVAARRAVEPRLTVSNAPALVAALPLFLRLRQLSRGEHGEIVGGVLQVLREPAAIDALTQGLAATDWRSRDLVYRVAIRSPASDVSGLLARALSDNSEKIRRWASEQLRQHVDVTGWRALLTRALRDRFASVRRDALVTAAQQAADATEVLQRGMLDPNPGVRGQARRALRRKDPSADVATFYREVLARDDLATKAVALLGLAETGKPGDAELAQAYAVHRLGRIRAAAVRCLSYLDPNHRIAAMLVALNDAEPRVSNEAAHALRRHPHLLAAIHDDIQFIGNQHAVSSHQRRNANRLLAVSEAYRRKWGAGP